MAEGHNRVVVGVDGSPSSRRALDWAAKEARLRGDSLEAVMAWHIPAQLTYPALPTVSFDFEGAAKEALADELAAVLGDDARTAISRVAHGPAAAVLIDASLGADLLVVGSRGHGEFSGMLLGSVSQHCTAHAHCPVVVVRCEDA